MPIQSPQERRELKMPMDIRQFDNSLSSDFFRLTGRSGSCRVLWAPVLLKELLWLLALLDAVEHVWPMQLRLPKRGRMNLFLFHLNVVRHSKVWIDRAQ
jgi:hypothetical protein